MDEIATASSEEAAEPLLKVRGLSVGFALASGEVVHAADSVSFDVVGGAGLGVVGESGCGKSVTLRSLLGLQAPGAILGGTAIMRGRDLLKLSEPARRAVRGSEVAMIFQDPGAALNPVLTVGDQLGEVLRCKAGLSRRRATREAVALLARVGIPAAQQRLRAYPHHLSGGLRQRVMIALALACRPAVLLADEPTTALDVTVQDQILTLLSELMDEYNMAVVLVSHDLGVIAQTCNTVAVMYAGRVVEYGTVDEVLDRPRHPYTRALIASVPGASGRERLATLPTIGGQPPDLSALPSGCAFHPRCPYCDACCRDTAMTLDQAIPNHSTACAFPERLPA
jgi:oligopeptide/dipeptide ABC transporter ATP-binding protein